MSVQTCCFLLCMVNLYFWFPVLHVRISKHPLSSQLRTTELSLLIVSHDNVICFVVKINTSVTEWGLWYITVHAVFCSYFTSRRNSLSRVSGFPIMSISERNREENLIWKVGVSRHTERLSGSLEGDGAHYKLHVAAEAATVKGLAHILHLLKGKQQACNCRDTQHRF